MSPFAEWQQLAGQALIITLCVLLLNILARVIAKKKRLNTGAATAALNEERLNEYGEYSSG